MTVTHKK